MLGGGGDSAVLLIVKYMFAKYYSGRSRPADAAYFGIFRKHSVEVIVTPVCTSVAAPRGLGKSQKSAKIP